MDLSGQGKAAVAGADITEVCVESGDDFEIPRDGEVVIKGQTK